MALFSRKIPFDRKLLLQAAEVATKKRRWRRAVKLYGQILAAERRNPDLHWRIAPLLARVGRPVDAWESFRVAAESPEIYEDPQRTAALYAKATAALPKQVEAWRALARARLRCQEPDAALAALLEGRKRFRKKRRNFEAILLLLDAQEIDPWKPTIVLDLCKLLKHNGRAGEALFLLEALDEKVDSDARLDTRRLIWQIDPTFGNAWRWMGARREAKRAGSNLGPRTSRRRA
jgi:tetratricopeptide (TPR) repeat protein